MGRTERIEALRGMLEEEISSFENRRRRDKHKAFRFRMVQASASAVTAVLLGLSAIELGLPKVVQEWFRASALMISAGATVFAAWDAFFDHRELWVRYTFAATALKKLRRELDFIAAGGESVTEADVDKLFQRFQEIMDGVSTSWQQLRGVSAPAEQSRKTLTVTE